MSPAPFVRLVIVLVICASAFATAAAQTPAPARSAAVPAEAQSPTTKKDAATPLPTGSIKGRLVTDDGQPLPNASVMVQSLTSTPTTKPTTVDREGRFVFEDLPAASYIIIATAPGYVAESTMLGDASEWPRHLIGSNVRIRMLRGGVITGTVTNAKGEPVVGVPVRATMSNGPSQSITNYFLGAGISETDDRGVYRLFGLLPGQYIVNAGGRGQFGQFAATGFDSDVPTYYPAATRDTAVPVSVRGGDETSGIDIKYRGLDGHSISGVILGDIQANSAAGAITLFLSHAGTTSMLSLGIVGITDPKRAFSFHGVADGEYDIAAGYFSTPNENALVATKRVTVRGSDVTGLELRMAPLASITGSVTLDPISEELKCDKRGSQVIETVISLPRDESKKTESRTIISMFGGGLGTLDDKGQFALRNLEAGKYRLEIKVPSESWYIRAISMPSSLPKPAPPSTTWLPPSPARPNAGDAWQGTITVKTGERIAPVSIMLGQDATGLGGRLTTDGSVIAAGTRVHLVPVDRESANNILRYSEALVSSDGSFAFTNIAPGRYYIIPRVEQPPETETFTRPSAWDPLSRGKLRREAEAAKTIIELKPCERVVDYALKLGPTQ